MARRFADSHRSDRPGLNGCSVARLRCIEKKVKELSRSFALLRLCVLLETLMRAKVRQPTTKLQRSILGNPGSTTFTTNKFVLDPRAGAASG